ncbi:MAG: hypothetical protein OEM46_05135 [Ignavibacteria bacterium]|nr:hypothetical protein [Ignavibacteria bacterium]
MEKQEKTQNTNEEKNSQSGCCDFSSEETPKMFKMMEDFYKDPEKDSSDCCSTMKEMMKNMSCKSDGCGCAEDKSNVQTKSNKSETKVEKDCC